VQAGIQRAGRVQVVAERLLDGDPAVAQEVRRREVLDDGAEQRRVMIDPSLSNIDGPISLVIYHQL
jgi:hypothetical protein